MTAAARGAPQPIPQIVAIGDLNGADDVLIDILRGTGLIDANLRWTGGRAELIQMGDVFNRGGGAVRALRLLFALSRQAVRVGGRVTVLLGNHEAMVALRHEGYCTEAEYLSFATAKERRDWPGRVERAVRRLVRHHSPRGAILPIVPRLEAWKVEHVPGRAALRRALGAQGQLGRQLRALPVAHRAQDCVFVHGGILPRWAKLGVDGMNARAKQEWSSAPACMWSLPRHSLFRSTSGPLWDRSLVRRTARARAALVRSLELLGAARMVVGHTQTSAVRGGQVGHILVHADRLVLVDVGLRAGTGTPRAALVIRGSKGYEWTPHGSRLLWDDGPADTEIQQGARARGKR